MGRRYKPSAEATVRSNTPQNWRPDVMQPFNDLWSKDRLGAADFRKLRSSLLAGMRGGFTSAGPDSAVNGTHSLRRTKASQI